MTGRFIAFEGGDASGKSTQAERVAEKLDALLTREPGGTAVGETLRSMLLDPDTSMALRTEALLMAASRAQLVADVVRPTLDAGRDVVTDRFLGSSVAYQGFGSGLDVDEVYELSAFAVDGTFPDLTVLIDVPVDIARSRLAGQPDRFESEGAAFQERVRQGYLEWADESGWVVIDGSGNLDQVSALVDEVVANLDTLLAPDPELAKAFAEIDEMLKK